MLCEKGTCRSVVLHRMGFCIVWEGVFGYDVVGFAFLAVDGTTGEIRGFAFVNYHHRWGLVGMVDAVRNGRLL
jgi:hypothetical protein